MRTTTILTASAMKRTLVISAQILIVVALLIAWQLASGVVVDEMLVSSPLAILARAETMIIDGQFAHDIVATIYVVVVGLMVGTAAGVAAGILTAMTPTWRPMIESVVNVLFALPKIALIPLFILWFGVTYSERIIFTAIVVFFFMFFAAVQGVQQTAGQLDRMMAILGASQLQRIWILYLPSSVQWIIAGLRIAVPYAFIGAISAEVVLSRDGIGHVVKISAAMMDISGMFVGIVTATLLATSAGGLVELLARSRMSQNNN